MPLREDLLDAAWVLGAQGLVDAFGHVSARTLHGTVLITPPRALGRLMADAELLEFALEDDTLPAGVPREAWIHWAIYRRRHDVEAICRAQPPTVAGVVAGGLTIRALHGQGAFVGAELAEHDDARLLRGRPGGEGLAKSLGEGSAVVMRGNGAVTVGADVGAATARMYVMEVSARINATAAAVGTPRPLTADEVSAWSEAAPEILGRLWAHLRETSQFRAQRSSPGESGSPSTGG